MLRAFNRWLNRRREIRRRWQTDARLLLTRDAPGAYYEAQRRAARARALGASGDFLHWAKTAAEIARIAPNAEMDITVIKKIADEELRK
ncbi:MAG: hypothetical protein CFE29_28570 [Bradyrhizobiaceae bacterium PARB1]|jgi:hypothetical protein|nr:MAG: hypothetical protein CFE29_28570 [Bradyrhizobiaceae bacterium PARB1]